VHTILIRQRLRRAAPGWRLGRQLHATTKRIETYCGRIEESFGRYPPLLLAEEEDTSSPSFFARAAAHRLDGTEKRAPMPRGDFSACRSKSAWPICAGVFPHDAIPDLR